MIYTNFNINNAIEEIKKHLKNIKYKKYIKDVLNCHLNYNIINKKEYTYLKEYYKI